jgi:23S rRNA pseudouridine955/2504/2580 synthase
MKRHYNVTTQATVSFHEIDENHTGQRLDNFLFTLCKDVPKSKIYQIIRTGQIRVNKKRAKPSQRLILWDIIRIPPLSRRVDPDDDREPIRLSSSRQELLTAAILFEDDDYLVMNKPRDFAVHGGSGIQQGLIEQMLLLRPELTFLQLCHRLDRETTGCLVLAKNRPALLIFQEQLLERCITKHYFALVHGRWILNESFMDFPLSKVRLADGEAKVVVDSRGKPALTEVIAVQLQKAVSYLEVALVTGRTHQVRVHCQYAGHPLLGDSKYGNRRLDQSLGLEQPLPLGLHAYRVAFEGRDQPYDIIALPDSNWLELTHNLGFDSFH